MASFNGESEDIVEEFVFRLVDGPFWEVPYYKGEITDEKAREYLKENMFVSVMLQLFKSEYEKNPVEVVFRHPHLGKFEREQVVRVRNARIEGGRSGRFLVDKASEVELVSDGREK